MAVNHQWTKSHEYEAALGEYRDRWLPGAPRYSSPLRPLFELQIIRSLAPHMDAYLKTASCNQTKGLGWCRKCAKCAWVFLATSASATPRTCSRALPQELGSGRLRLVLRSLCLAAQAA